MLKGIIERFKRRDMIAYAKAIGVDVGENVLIAANVNFDTEPYLIKIGGGSYITSGVRFVTHDGAVYVLKRNGFLKGDGGFPDTISIGENCYIGNNVSIMPGVHIGNNVIVGYGSIVTHSIPDNEVWAGIPARRVETLQEYLEKKKDKYILAPSDPEGKKKYLLDYFKCRELQSYK